MASYGQRSRRRRAGGLVVAASPRERRVTHLKEWHDVETYPPADTPACRYRFHARPFAVALAAALLAAGMAAAVEVPERSALGEKEFRHPDLDISTILRPAAELPAGEGTVLAVGDLAGLGSRWTAVGWTPVAAGGRLSRRATRCCRAAVWATSLRGRVSLAANRADDVAWRAAAAGVFREYLETNAVALRINVGELAGDGRVTVHDDGAVVQIYVPRIVRGVSVRDSYLTAVINHGNLVLFGANVWGDVEASATPRLSAAEALVAVQAHVEPFRCQRLLGEERADLPAHGSRAGSANRSS